MAETTQTGSGEHGDAPEEAGAGPEPGYNPLKQYDPEREFDYIVEARTEVDATLLDHTRPFAEGVLRLIHLSAFAVVWAAGIMPALEAVSWFGFTPGPFWHGAVILSVPAGVLLFALGWLFIRLPIMMKWVAVYIEMYLDDEISNLLIRERDASRGELKGIHIGSNIALLRLLRLRMRAFHFWHRISIHTFILNGMFFRRVLETPFRAPRLWANGVPILALTVFLSMQWGMLMGEGGLPADFMEAAQAYGARLWAALTALRLGGGVEGPYAAPYLAAGFALAFFAYWLSRRARGKVTARLEGFLDTSHFLTPSTHDCSRDILAKHEQLIRILARIVARGRNGPGEMGSNELSELLLREGLDDAGLEDDPV
ncbi:MAG: hypothetical protein ACLFWF_06720 [Alphaproteobacteria bacterium]